METYTTEQLLSSNLSTEFYSAETIDAMIGNLSCEEAAAILDKISSDINPKLSDIADAVSSHIKETSRFIDKSEDSLEEISENISTLSARVANTYTKSEINDKNNSLKNTILNTVNTNISNAITPLSTDVKKNRKTVNALDAINSQLSAIATLPDDGSASTLDIINKINEILGTYSYVDPSTECWVKWIDGTVKSYDTLNSAANDPDYTASTDMKELSVMNDNIEINLMGYPGYPGSLAALSSITIPELVTVGTPGLYAMGSLMSVTFLNRTKAQVQAIQSYQYWSMAQGCVIHCSDGDIQK